MPCARGLGGRQNRTPYKAKCLVPLSPWFAAVRASLQVSRLSVALPSSLCSLPGACVLWLCSWLRVSNALGCMACVSSARYNAGAPVGWCVHLVTSSLCCRLVATARNAAGLVQHVSLLLVRSTPARSPHSLTEPCLTLTSNPLPRSCTRIHKHARSSKASSAVSRLLHRDRMRCNASHMRHLP